MIQKSLLVLKMFSFCHINPDTSLIYLMSSVCTYSVESSEVNKEPLAVSKFRIFVRRTIFRRNLETRPNPSNHQPHGMVLEVWRSVDVEPLAYILVTSPTFS